MYVVDSLLSEPFWFYSVKHLLQDVIAHASSITYNEIVEISGQENEQECFLGTFCFRGVPGVLWDAKLSSFREFISSYSIYETSHHSAIYVKLATINYVFSLSIAFINSCIELNVSYISALIGLYYLNYAAQMSWFFS